MQREETNCPLAYVQLLCADAGEGGGEPGEAGGGCERQQGSTNKQKDLGFAPAEVPAGLDFFYVSHSGHKY